jgi:molybdate transport system substrate-binding protein
LGLRPLFVFVAAIAVFAGVRAHAAALSVFVTGSMAEPFRVLSETYARSSGDSFTFVAGTTKMVMDRLDAGGKPDIIVISSQAGDRLEKRSAFLAGTRRDVARSLFGVAVKEGAPVPDISTVDAFKKTVLAAKSISYPDAKGGAVTGIYLEKLFQRFGIAGTLKAKTFPKRLGADVAHAVADGEIELGLTFISELVAVKGVHVVGRFPDAIQDPQLYTAAVAATSKYPAAARAFIAFVTSPESGAKLKAMGVAPVAK